MSVVKMELPSPFPHVEQKTSLNPERIRCARETAGLSKVQLAESLGVTSRTVTNYEEVGALGDTEKNDGMTCKTLDNAAT